MDICQLVQRNRSSLEERLKLGQQNTYALTWVLYGESSKIIFELHDGARDFDELNIINLVEKI